MFTRQQADQVVATWLGEHEIATILYIAGTAHPLEHYLQEFRRGNRTKA